MTQVNPDLIGDDEYDGLIGRTSQVNGLCTLTRGKAFDVAMFRMNLALMDDEGQEGDEQDEEDEDKDKEKDKEKEKEKKKEEEEEKEPMIDGMPESFIGPLLADLTCHEVAVRRSQEEHGADQIIGRHGAFDGPHPPLPEDVDESRSSRRDRPKRSSFHTTNSSPSRQ